MEETKQVVSEEEILESLANLANPNCKKCNGTGRLGWRIDGDNREVIPCAARNCALHKYHFIKLMKKREELIKQQEEEKNKEATKEETNEKDS